MDFNIVVLGCNSAIPAHGRHPSAQLVSISKEHFLIDAGEGTQMQLSRYRRSPMKISRIFISHLHGDHVFGLPGLLTTMRLLNRTATLDIYGPAALQDMVTSFLHYAGVLDLPYKVQFHTVKTQTKTLIFQGPNLSVYAFPLVHKIETFGYLFEERIRYFKLDREALERYQVPNEQRAALARGEDWRTPDGRSIPNAAFVAGIRKPRRYAYCSDTRYEPGIVPWIEGVDLLYHEATYMHEMQAQAYERFHSTALQAAKIASMAKVDRLLLGHFSSKYKDLSPLVEEARSCHTDCEAAEEGRAYVLK